jgi:hypothetical protein
MKLLKNIIIASDGSINFSDKIVKTNSSVSFQLHDDKNCSFYQKIRKTSVDSKHLQTYKKKYLK